MVPSAKGDEIREIGLSSIHPMDHVMHFREVDKGTACEATTFVPTRDLDPLGHGGAAAHALLIEDGAVAVLDREHDLGVAGQTPRHLWRDRTHARQVGATIRVQTGEKSQIGVHDHGRAISAPSIARKLLAMGCYQVSLGDTIGVGTPRQTERILELMLAELPPEQIAMHMHDTRGVALANVLVGLEMGVRDFDASVGGMGGCPYAPGAAGNLATEDLVYMLRGMGVETGVDLERLWEAGKVAESIVGRALPGKVHQAGVQSLKA